MLTSDIKIISLLIEKYSFREVMIALSQIALQAAGIYSDMGISDTAKCYTRLSVSLEKDAKLVP